MNPASEPLRIEVLGLEGRGQILPQAVDDLLQGVAQADSVAAG